MSYLLEMDMRKLLDLLTHLDGFFFYSFLSRDL